MIETRLLQYFLTVAQELNITKAQPIIARSWRCRKGQRRLKKLFRAVMLELFSQDRQRYGLK